MIFAGNGGQYSPEEANMYVTAEAGIHVAHLHFQKMPVYKEMGFLQGIICIFVRGFRLRVIKEYYARSVIRRKRYTYAFMGLL